MGGGGGHCGHWCGRWGVLLTSRAGCHCFVARVHENEKNPVNIGLQGFLLSPSIGVLPEVVWRRVVALEVAPASGACHARSSKKTLKKLKSGGSQTPHLDRKSV